MLSLLMAMALAATTPGDAPRAGLSGAWTLTDTLPRFQVTFTLNCKLSQSDASLHGVCADPQGKASTVSGSVSGGKVIFSYRADFAGVASHFNYAGELQPDGRLVGTLLAGELAGTFQATRP
jgi:hypothetical protein